MLVPLGPSTGLHLNQVSCAQLTLAASCWFGHEDGGSTFQITRRHIPGDNSVHSDRCEISNILATGTVSTHVRT
jgi:hypothetical protein